jgi:cytochrome P450
LTEGLRLSPAIATRAARISDRDLFYGGQWRIPAGTPVGMTTLLMHTDEALYPDPMRFDPERWMVVDPNTKLRVVERRRWFAPFSRGTRVCLGMQ